MANAIYSHSFSGNHPKALARKMMFESLKRFFWGKFAKFNTPDGKPVKPGTEPNTISSPIVMQNELQRMGGDILEIPIHRNLSNLPTVGNDQMEGHEEEPKVNFAKVPIDIMRHAEKPQDGSMSTQRNKELRLLENTRPALLRHYARAEEYLGASYALYKGYSYNILQGGNFSSDSYIGSSYTDHPHIYAAGDGKVSYSGGYPGTSGYQTAVGTAISGLGASDVFDTGFLQALKADPQIQRITPIIMNDGNALRLIVAHPWQIASLEADSNFQSTINSAMAQQYAKNNPLLVGCKYIYAGFAIFESDTAVWPVSQSAGIPVYGYSSLSSLNTFEDYSSYTAFGAFVLGDNALFKAIGSGMEFKKREADYGELIGIAYRIIQGYARGDYWNRDDGTTGQYINNDGSALLLTYAAAPSY